MSEPILHGDFQTMPAVWFCIEHRSRVPGIDVVTETRWAAKVERGGFYCVYVLGERLNGTFWRINTRRALGTGVNWSADLSDFDPSDPWNAGIAGLQPPLGTEEINASLMAFLDTLRGASKTRWQQLLAAYKQKAEGVL